MHCLRSYNKILPIWTLQLWTQALEIQIIEAERQQALTRSILSKLEFPVGLSLFEVCLLTRQDNLKYFVQVQTDQYSDTFVLIFNREDRSMCKYKTDGQTAACCWRLCPLHSWNIHWWYFSAFRYFARLSAEVHQIHLKYIVVIKHWNVSALKGSIHGGRVSFAIRPAALCESFKGQKYFFS